MVSVVAPVQGNRHQVLRRTGEGGTGIVFLSQDTLLGPRATAKVIND